MEITKEIHGETGSISSQQALLDKGTPDNGAQGASPFIAGTKLQFAWDSTSLGWLKSCPRQYQYSMIEGRRAKTHRIDLEFGILYHHGIEVYDRERTSGAWHDGALRTVVKEALVRSWDWPKDEIDPNKNRETLVRSLIWYLEEFRDDNAKTLVLANGKPAVELSFKFPLDFGPQDAPSFGIQHSYVLCGHIDRLVEFAGQTFVLDHKTSKYTLSSSYFDNFEPDNQMTLYTLASQIVWSAPVKGVIIDAAQIAVGFTRFERGITYRTQGQLEEWLGDLKILLRQNEEYVRNDHWPMNDKSCRLCSFKKICSKDPSVREKFLEAEFKREPWNPLITR